MGGPSGRIDTVQLHGLWPGRTPAYAWSMDNLARDLGEATVREAGLVMTSSEGHFQVHTQRGRYEARRAVSCLVEPMAGDLVVVEALADGRVYIATVLEREEGAGATLRVDGDLRVCPNGRLSLAAQEGVDLASGKDVSIVAASVAINAVEGHFGISAVRFVGQQLDAQIDRVKAFATTMDSVVDRVSMKAKRVFRIVDELDQLRAERVDYRAQKTMSLRGRELLATAEKLVKVDGKQIHLG